MRRKTKKKLKIIAKGATEIILDILRSFDQITDYMIFDYYHRGWPKDYSKRTTYHTIRRLKKQGLIEIKKRKTQTYYQLTITGRERLLIKSIEQNRIERKDGYATVIIFDIPEDKRKTRMFLRRLLLRNGFVNLQKSVMISRFELHKDFFELLENLQIRQNVTLMKSKIIRF